MSSNYDLVCRELRSAFSPRLEEVASHAAVIIETLVTEVARLRAGDLRSSGKPDRIPLIITRAALAEARLEAYAAGSSSHKSLQIDGEEVEL